DPVPAAVLVVGRGASLDRPTAVRPTRRDPGASRQRHGLRPAGPSRKRDALGRFAGPLTKTITRKCLMTTSRSNRDKELGMGPGITRKDFFNATLLGVGGMLLHSAAPAELLARLASSAGSSPRGGAHQEDPWTGYGGVGDYARSNGNTRAVLEAAHRIRDGDRKSTRLNSSHVKISYAVFCLKKKNKSAQVTS